MGNLGAGEILLIVAIALLIFGPSKLSDMGKGLGEGLKNFKKGLSQDDENEDPKAKDPPQKAAEPPKALAAPSPPIVEKSSPAVVSEPNDADKDTTNVPRRDG
jgi:sec-independent protein translocase protein TatA